MRDHPPAQLALQDRIAHWAFDISVLLELSPKLMEHHLQAFVLHVYLDCILQMWDLLLVPIVLLESILEQLFRLHA
jgi:hypothetical protein